MLDSLANCVRERTERAKNGNGSCTVIERGLNGNGRSVARTGYGNFLLTPTVHVHIDCVQLYMYMYMYMYIYILYMYIYTNTVCKQTHA